MATLAAARPRATRSRVATRRAVMRASFAAERAQQPAPAANANKAAAPPVERFPPTLPADVRGKDANPAEAADATLALRVSSPEVLLNHMAERYTSSSRIVMEARASASTKSKLGDAGTPPATHGAPPWGGSARRAHKLQFGRDAAPQGPFSAHEGCGGSLESSPKKGKRECGRR